MRVKFHFNPPPGIVRDAHKYEFLVAFEYKMFPELVEQFNPDEYPSILVPLAEELDINDNPEYLAEFDRPYGTYTAGLKFRVKDAAEGDDGYEPIDLP